jgi:hypothetical protein
VKDVMLKEHPMPQHLTSDGGALVGMCGKDEELWLNMAAH